MNEKHLADTLANRLPGWPCDCQEFINELLKDLADAQAAAHFAIERAVIVEEKAKPEPKPSPKDETAIIELKADEHVVEKLVVEKKSAGITVDEIVEKKSKKKAKKGFFGRSKK